jgi:hypothetical protein
VSVSDAVPATVTGRRDRRAERVAGDDARHERAGGDERLFAAAGPVQQARECGDKDRATEHERGERGDEALVRRERVRVVQEQTDGAAGDREERETSSRSRRSNARGRCSMVGTFRRSKAVGT